jgi:hypothetical protein
VRTALLALVVCVLQASDAPILSPALQRLDLVPASSATVVFDLRGNPGGIATHAATDCACVTLLTPLPLRLDGQGRGSLSFRVTGLRPGVEDILVATSAGIARAQIQIVGPGAGRGRDQLAAALATAQAKDWAVWGIVHDLAGSVRQCGCSAGSLGGIDRLAALPALARSLAPQATTRWILSGDSDGKHPGLSTALCTHGWSANIPEVRVSADPLPLLGLPGITAIIPTAPVAVQHRRIVRPVLTGGLVVELLLVDAQGQIQERRTAPVDDSLPAESAILAQFPDRLTSTLDHTTQPATACAGCHPTAYAAWQRTAHARALDSLKPADRTDACIGCHTTAIAERVLAPAVNCQSCHTGSDAHVASGGTIKTTGAVDCRSCHDAKHHPAFQREAGWKLIEHGREPAKP